MLLLLLTACLHRPPALALGESVAPCIYDESLGRPRAVVEGVPLDAVVQVEQCYPHGRCDSVREMVSRDGHTVSVSCSLAGSVRARWISRTVSSDRRD